MKLEVIMNRICQKANDYGVEESPRPDIQPPLETVLHSHKVAVNLADRGSTHHMVRQAPV